MTITNPGNLTPHQLLDDMLESWWEEEAWARNLGFASAAEYQTEAQESFDASYQSREVW